MKKFIKYFHAYSRRLTVFKGFLITYMAIILVFAITCGFTYVKLFGEIDEYENKNTISLLEQSDKLVAQYINEIDNLPELLMGNDRVINYLSNDMYNISTRFYNPASAEEIVAVLSNYRNTNLLIDDIVLFSPHSDKIITSRAAFDGRTNYGSLFEIENLTYDGVRNSLLKDYSHRKLVPETATLLSGSRQTDIMHITSLSPYSQRADGSCIIFINSERLMSMLLQNLGDTKAFVYLFDKDGRLITKTDSAPEAVAETFAADGINKIDGKQYIVRSSSGSDRYTIALAMPYRSTLRHSMYLKRIVVTIILLCISACLVLAFAFAAFSSRPMYRLLQRLSPDDGAVGNEYETIFSAVENLLDNVQASHDAFEANLPMLRMNFVSDLIHGVYSSKEDAKETADGLRLDIDGAVYAALIVRTEQTGNRGDSGRFENISLSKKVITKGFSEKMRFLSSDFGSDGLVMILCFDSDSQNENLMLAENTVQAMSDLLFESLEMRTVASMGGFYKKLTDIIYSYETAKDCLTNGIQTTLRHNTWCTPNMSGFSLYYYPLEVENKLISAFRSGNTVGVYEVLNTVYDENANKRVLSGDMISCLYSDMKNTVYKILGASGNGDGVPDVRAMLAQNCSSMPLPEFFQMIKDVYAMLDERKAKTEDDDIAEKMLSFVRREALSQDFGRQTFAEHFYISEDYVSKYFKDNTGKNFLKYVTEVKMNAAQKMLLDGNYTVDKIAEAVGYNSSISFRRMFKNYTGCTPSEWRQQNIKE